MISPPNQSNISVTVVVPFFQRKSGILRKAVQSALAQEGQVNTRILVVDDCSPVSAHEELRDYLAQHPEKFTIMTLPANSGQSVARNTALDSLAAGIEYVAFLDSDDEWDPRHLARALCALESGYDFFFSDFYQLNQSVSAFQRAKRINPDDHTLIPGCGNNIHRYEGNLVDQIIRGNVIGTPTVVYRFRKFPGIRFRKEFRSAGEDYLFWLDVAAKTDKVAFSSAISCTCGEGVNVFSSALWGSDGSIRKLHDEMRYLRVMRQEFASTAAQRKHVRTRISAVRYGFTREIIHRLLHRKKIDWALSRGLIRQDPLTLAFFVPGVMRLFMERTSNRNA